MPVFTTVESTSETSYRMHVSLRAVNKFKSNLILYQRFFKNCSTYKRIGTFINIPITMCQVTEGYLCN